MRERERERERINNASMLINNGRRFKVLLFLENPSHPACYSFCLQFAVGLPEYFKTNVQGLCGNWDGNRENDMMTRDGTQVGLHDYATVGNSWQAEGVEGEG